jgi:hypothetical protein
LQTVLPHSNGPTGISTRGATWYHLWSTRIKCQFESLLAITAPGSCRSFANRAWFTLTVLVYSPVRSFLYMSTTMLSHVYLMRHVYYSIHLVHMLNKQEVDNLRAIQLSNLVLSLPWSLICNHWRRLVDRCSNSVTVQCPQKVWPDSITSRNFKSFDS